MAFALTSPAFRSQGRIPENYAQGGKNISPPLNWSGVPEEAKSLVLIVEDPDAPGGAFTHWAAFDIDPSAGKLAAGAVNLHQAVNDLGHAHYDGPKPPKGDGLHHYHFRLAALDVDRLDVGREPTYEDVKNALDGHQIAVTELVGTFETR